MDNKFLAVVAVFLIVITGGMIYLIAKPIPSLPESKVTIMGSEFDARQDTISVTAEGKYILKPDVAYVELGVFNQNKTAKEAQEFNTITMNLVIDSVKRMGLNDKDIQTTTYRIRPKYEYRDGKAPLVVGYEVTNMVLLTIRSTEDIGKVLDSAISAGANQTYNIRFGVEDSDNAYNEALKHAIANAKHKANVIASQAGRKIKKALIIDEGNGYTGGFRRAEEQEYSLKMKDSTQVSTGEMDIKASVNVIFELE